MTDWHVPDDLMQRFSTGLGEVDDVTAGSIEQHLTACRSCQGRLGELSPRPVLDTIWAEVEDRVDRSGSGFTERLLRRLGVEAGWARLLAATPALRVGALLAVALVVATVVLVSRAANAAEAFLVVAPLVPTALVALSFAPGVDPAGESGLATPLYGFPLVMRRALAIEVVSILILAIGSVFVPIVGLRALGWLLPALALSLGTLAGSVRWSAPHTAAGLSMVWMASVMITSVTDGSRSLADSIVFDPSGQLVLALLAMGAGVVTATNRQELFQEVVR